MLQIVLLKNKLLFLIFISFCTIFHTCNTFVLSPTRFSISHKNIYRCPLRIYTRLYSVKEDSSHENNENNDNIDDELSKLLHSPIPDDNDLEGYDFSQVQSTDVESNSETPTDISLSNFDKFHFDPEIYKSMIESYKVYKGPSYSLTEYNQPLPEGCRTIVDFLKYPRNYNFARSTDISLNMEDMSSAKIDAISPELGEAELENRMEGPYLESGYQTIGDVAQSTSTNYFTREEDEEPVQPEKMLSILEQKDIKSIKEYKRNRGSESESSDVSYKSAEKDENVVKDELPVSKINPNYFMFDPYGYLKHYLTYINKYNYDVFSYHNKNDERPSFYLNHEYVNVIEKPFPPDSNNTLNVRKHFLSLIPTLMDKLVEYIKNDPNKDRTPSPPMHDLTLLQNYKKPEYLEDDYESDGEVDYEMYASIKTLHDPRNEVIYPFYDFEPILKRRLLSTYLEIYNTQDLGPLKYHKVYRSRSKQLKTNAFPTHTRPPKGDSDINLEEKPINSGVFVERRIKLYEQGKRKRGKAMVYLEPGNGNIIINNRDGYQYVYYNEFRLREILEPLSKLEINTNFNIVAKTKGGGISGQSVAIRHALVRYLYRILSPKLKYILRKFDLVSIDRRRTERKKTNLRKARKKEKYSKR
ncbi:Ribosomal protein S9/S16 family protein [Theileria parva strain Muguga]|uniref:40S ribosomal protein S9, putative n=1 Tax=Theileria parva TaxID=5875 RepID=Q4N5E3_THEPA|nr:Ribosomal protein S9/S16 family protein [Theileria parva strain Muguga]EAN32630.1 Ribosomal protein S9/S16 family protein [Theileria parva strain Muguga]|eukprot:XP_764913.1 40S ribosomal protein S9 [Theileria parva strain Muguga]